MKKDKLQTLKKEFQTEKERLGFFDLNVWIGRDIKPTFKDILTAKEVLIQMDIYNISQVIVTHTASKNYDPTTGNEILLEEIKGYDRLWGSIILVPESTKEQGDIKTYIDKSLKQKMRMIRMFPLTHNFSLQTWSCGSVLKVLEERRIPLVLWHSESNWNEINNLCETHCDLPLIISGTEGMGRKILYYNRFYYPLLERHKNLYLEMHNLVNYQVVEDIVSKFGPGKLIFGSYLPIQDPNAIMMLVTHANISNKDKEKIAHGNIEKILSEIKL